MWCRALQFCNCQGVQPAERHEMQRKWDDGVILGQQLAWACGSGVEWEQYTDWDTWQGHCGDSPNIVNELERGHCWTRLSRAVILIKWVWFWSQHFKQWSIIICREQLTEVSETVDWIFGRWQVAVWEHTKKMVLEDMLAQSSRG